MMHNKYNEAMAVAVKQMESAQVPDRECIVEGRRATLTLHGETCLQIDRENATVTVNGSAKLSRKTVRFVNTILSLFVTDRVMSRSGTWYAVDGKGVWKDFSGKELTLKIAL